MHVRIVFCFTATIGTRTVFAPRSTHPPRQAPAYPPPLPSPPGISIACCPLGPLAHTPDWQGDQHLRFAAHEGLKNASNAAQNMCGGTEPIGGSFARCGQIKGIARCAKRSHKDLGATTYTGMPIVSPLPPGSNFPQYPIMYDTGTVFAHPLQFQPIALKDTVRSLLRPNCAADIELP